MVIYDFRFTIYESKTAISKAFARLGDKERKRQTCGAIQKTGASRLFQAFSLTPALSRWEGETFTVSLEYTRQDLRDHHLNKRAYPVAAGEGQGEGEPFNLPCIILPTTAR